MITYCNKCGINWARLNSQDDTERDETVEFCPVCKTDAHLEPGNDIVAYICCPFTGKITNVDTGELLELKPATLVSIPTRRILVWDEPIEEWRKRVEEMEDKTPLDVTVPRVDRKHHFETI